MRPRTRKHTVEATGSLPWIAWNRGNSNKSVMVAVDGTATYKLQHTLSDLQRGPAPTVVDDSEVTGKTGTELFSTKSVLSGTRVYVTAVTGTPTITVTYADTP